MTGTKKRTFSPILTNITFGVLVILVCAFFDYHNILFKAPQSTHAWRQSDAASIALNLYRGDAQFFNLETHNLTSEKGTNGKCATSEVPILYAAVAGLYHVFGPHHSVYRAFTTFIFLLGILYLFKTGQRIFKNSIWSASIALLVFSSPVLTYYGNNFLTNVPSFSFVCIGWYYLVKYFQDHKRPSFYTATVLFLVAACLKLTALLTPFAFMGTLVLFKLFRRKDNLAQNFWALLWPMALIPVLVGAWVFYAHWFNLSHQCTYFSTTIFPIWELTWIEIQEVTEKVKTLWLDEYFHPVVAVFYLLFFVLFSLRFSKINARHRWLIILILPQVILYILLQFWTFADHDYYVINLYLLPMLLMLFGAKALQQWQPRIFKHKLTYLGLFLLTLTQVFYASERQNLRFHSWRNNYEENKSFYSIQPTLRKLGITPRDTVIAIPDPSHVSLYVMDQKGWTTYTDYHFNSGKKTRYNQDREGIEQSIEKGARYLIIRNLNDLLQRPYLKSFTHHLLDTHQQAFIFDLQQEVKNFQAFNAEPKQVYACDAETINQQGTHFVDPVSKTQFEYAQLRSSNKSRSGSYSIELNKATPFGFTIDLDTLKAGERIRISIWKKSNGSNLGYLVCSGANNLYMASNKADTVDSEGWARISLALEVSTTTAKKGLRVFAHQPDSGVAYFDDLKIHRYPSMFLDSQH